jgi:peroxiredoxin
MRFVGQALIASFLLSVAGVASALSVGNPAPDFKLRDEAGKEHSLSQYKGKLVVLEWTDQGCPFVVTHYDKDTMETLSAKYGAKDVVWLAVNSTHNNTPVETVAWKAKEKFTYATLMDNDGKVGKTYGATNTPHMYIIDKDGKLAYQGAIDDDPSDSNPKRKNYVDAGLNDLLGGKKVAQAETKAYGCSVKYK